MRLQQISTSDYDIDNEWLDYVADRCIIEIAEYSGEISKTWYVLNESTGEMEIDQELFEAGLGQILRKGAEKISNIAMKGRVGLDQLKMKVADKLKGKHGDGVVGKLGALAKNNAKYVKPAIVIAVVGAAMLGMDTASASDALSQMDQMGSGEFGNYMDQMSNEFNDFQAGGEGDTAGGQTPQTDASPVKDQPPVDANAGGPSNMDKAQADIVRSTIGQKVGDVTITQDMVLDVIKNGKFPGADNMDDFMQQVYSKAPSPEKAAQYVKQAFNQALMQKLKGG